MSKDFLKDVKPDPSAGTEPVESDPIEPIEPDTESAEGAQGEGDDGEGGEGEGGRTAENVYRELSRKQTEFQDDMSAAFGKLAEGQHAMQEAITGFAAKAPEKQTGNTLDDMSISQLRTLRTDVVENNPDKVAEFDAYMTDRIVEDKLNARLGEFQTATHAETQRASANEVAKTRYPDLGKSNSEFRDLVNNKLNEFGETYIANNPRAVLDAANDVAAEMGVAPSAPTHTTTRMRGRIAGTRTSKGNESTDEVGSLPVSDTEFDAIADRLADAMPAGKQFDKKQLKENMKSYGDHSHFFVRG